MTRYTALVSSVQRFRDAIARRVVAGTFSKCSDPAFIEIMGHAGFDFVVLNLEHRPNTVLSLQDLIRAALLTGLFTEKCRETIDSLGISRDRGG